MKYFIAILAIVVVGTAWFWMKETPTEEVETVQESVIEKDVTDEEVMEPDITFTISGVNYAFNVQEMRVKKGDMVRVDFTSKLGFHDWVVDEFDARTEKVRPGVPTSITFVADEVGTFEYYCSVGNHREQGMVGSLIVEE